MGLRFSIKWLLVGTVYIAVAAAALATEHWTYATILYSLTFCAVVYAIIVAVFSRGPRQLSAGGFAIASVLFVFCLKFAPPGAWPMEKLVLAAFPQQSLSVGPSPPVVPGRPRLYRARVRYDITEKVWAGNAVSTIMAGLIGCCLAALGFPKRQPTPNAD